MENDLISRGALEVAVRELADKHHALGQIEFANGVIKTITRIHAAPAIDAVPVVRCGKCGHTNPCNYRKGYVFCWHPSLSTQNYDDEDVRFKTDFCSYGVRMDAEEAQQ